MISPETRASIQNVAHATMVAGRFVKQSAAWQSGTTGKKRGFTDSIESFSGRLRLLDASEVPTTLATSGEAVYRLTGVAGVTLSVDDKIKDEQSGTVYSVLGKASESESVSEFFVGVSTK